MSLRHVSASRMPGRAPQVEREGAHQHPLRPEVAVGAAEGPDQDADHVYEGVLERERAPASVAGAEARRGNVPRKLAQSSIEISGRPGAVDLGEPRLELFHRQTAAV